MGPATLEFDDNKIMQAAVNTENGISNAEFISYLFSVTIRLIIYAALSFVIFVFLRGKAIDPVGYQRLTNAFTFTEQKSGVQLENFIPTAEYFNDNKQPAPSPCTIPSRDQSQAPEQSLSRDIQSQRQELLKLSLQCHLLEGKVGVKPGDCKCNKLHISIHEIVLDRELELHSRPIHQILLSLLKTIYDQFYEEIPSDDPIALDQMELKAYTDDSIDLPSQLQEKTLAKLSIAHQSILEAKRRLLQGQSGLVVDSKIEGSVNSRALKLLREFPLKH